MSAPPTPTLDGALRPASAPRTPPPAPAAGRRPGPAAQLVLALLCGAYAVGAAFGWGSERLALIMGDFGLSAAAAAAAVSCALRPQPPHPLPARLDTVRALLGHGVPGEPGLGLVRGGARP